MSKTGRPNYRRSERERNRQARAERRIYLRTVRRDPPDVVLLSKAFLALALNEAKADKAAEAPTDDGTDGGQEADHDD